MSQKSWNLQDIRPARPDRGQVQRELPPNSPPPQRRPSVDIAPSRRPAPEPMRPPIDPREQLDPDLANIPVLDGTASRRTRVVVASLVSILIVGAAIGVNILMGGAEVTVYPKFKDVAVQATFVAERTPKAGSLGYELLSLDVTGERQVKASGSQKVSERALGTMFIYNTEEKSTRLIKNTRFESPDGLIFRIKESVEVPKATKDAQGSLVPGVVTTEVFADGTGEQYNVGPSRFTLPGLKDSPQFKTVYGETTVAMTGGFEGERFLIDDAEYETKRQELHLELRNSLLARLSTERPSGFLLYPDAVTFTYESLPASMYGDSLATIKEKVTLHVPLFSESEFAAYIAKSTIAGYENDPVRILNPESLTYTYTGATTSQSDISDDLTIEFMLKGTPRIAWQFDEAKLKNDLKGLAESALPLVLSSYRSIDRADAVVRPFWNSSFPENPAEITVTTILDDAITPSAANRGTSQ